MSELKTCPFCGKPGVLQRDICGWQVYCAGFCGCQLSDNDHDKMVVVKRWNTRSQIKEAGEKSPNKTHDAIALVKEIEYDNDRGGEIAPHTLENVIKFVEVIAQQHHA